MLDINVCFSSLNTFYFLLLFFQMDIEQQFTKMNFEENSMNIHWVFRESWWKNDKRHVRRLLIVWVTSIFKLLFQRNTQRNTCQASYFSENTCMITICFHVTSLSLKTCMTYKSPVMWHVSWKCGLRNGEMHEWLYFRFSVSSVKIMWHVSQKCHKLCLP